MIVVLNKRTLADTAASIPALPALLIDRTTQWGNPTLLGQTTSRTESVAAYLAYARERFSDLELVALDDHALVCWCAPKRCHGNALQLLVASAKSETRKRVLISGEAPRGGPMALELAARYRRRLWQRLDQVPRNGVIVEGGARGVDTFAKEYAIEHRMDYVEWPADWEEHGPRAGSIRNQEMLDLTDPDEVICLHQDIRKSRGTKDMLRRAQTQGFEWELLPLEEPERYPKRWVGPVVGRE
jgi:hypothetical protein